MANNILKLDFFGAASTVTGSKFLLTINEKKILIDCGLFQGLKNLRLKNWKKLPFEASELDAVLLTHAHIDHSGCLPLLVKEGYTGPIYTTHATASLSKIMLPDAAYIQEEEAKYLNKHGATKHKPALPLYTVEEANKTLNQYKTLDWEKAHEILEDIHVKFFPVSHLLGAAAIQIQVLGKTITFSGDLGRDDNPLLLPKHYIRETDILLIESTYGDRLHDKQSAQEQLGKIINTTTQRGGCTIIPTFAVGRAQDILYHIYQLKKAGAIPNIPVYLNSPMATEATQTYASHAQELKIGFDDIKKIFSPVHYVRSREESERLNNLSEPSIIISSSGMLTGGRILHLIRAKGSDSRNSIVLVGYQAPGTRGEALSRGKKFLKIHGQEVSIDAEVHQMHQLSAHADYEDLLDWVAGFDKRPPQKIFIVHGEPVACDEFRQHIEKRFGIEAIIPELNDSFDLL